MQMQRSLLLRLAAPITSWDTLSEIARDSVAKKRLSESEMTNLMDRFEERRVQWVAASNTIEARLRKSCAIPRATGWAELEADDFELRQRWRRQLDSDSESEDEDSCEVRVHIPLTVSDRWVLCRCHQILSSGNVTGKSCPYIWAAHSAWMVLLASRQPCQLKSRQRGRKSG